MTSMMLYSHTDHKDIWLLDVLTSYVSINYSSELLYSHTDHKGIWHLHVLTSNVSINYLFLLLYSHTDHKGIWQLHVLNSCLNLDSWGLLGALTLISLNKFVSGPTRKCASCVYHPLASHVSVRLVSWNEKWPLIVMVNHILNIMIKKINMHKLTTAEHQARGEHSSMSI